ncbi:PREDICTED: uncharacterized protein LOC109481380 [Branchiostoma belcheri]|uniref:Uncharacterized protein LOC109481380 n=1 Tax=Branchiostoma belcheri TaxID=7741 RepID=A0A6P5A834_BRABE|nr:PREDICTED: uncharacterized protein LOC109481380 [Branchiostoma belcheri]
MGGRRDAPAPYSLLGFAVILIVGGTGSAAGTRNAACGLNYRPCSSPGGRTVVCVHVQYVCDGTADCPNAEDEQGCTADRQTTPQYDHSDGCPPSSQAVSLPNWAIATINFLGFPVTVVCILFLKWLFCLGRKKAGKTASPWCSCCGNEPDADDASPVAIETGNAVLAASPEVVGYRPGNGVTNLAAQPDPPPDYNTVVSPTEPAQTS